MKAEDIRKYLRDFRILSRWTTFNGAIQSALAVPDEFDEQRVARLLGALDQHWDDDLVCVYCRKPAYTWDHLRSTVENKRFSGYGHRIFNLVPACRTCNEKKGSKPWREFVAEVEGLAHEHREDAVRRLAAVEALNEAESYPWNRIQATYPEQAGRYEKLAQEVHAKLVQLDELALELKNLIRAETSRSTTMPREGHAPREVGAETGTWSLVIQNQEHRALSKRDLILALVTAAVAAGTSPERLSRYFPRGPLSWLSADGTLRHQDFLKIVAGQRAPRGGRYDTARYFTKDHELIHFGGRTYALTNQWGADGWSAAVDGVIKDHPGLNAGYQRLASRWK